MACASMLNHVWFCVTPWTVACQASLSMGFSRWEYWSGLPFPPPVDLPDPGIEPMSPVSPALQAGALQLSHLGSPCVIKKKSKKAFKLPFKTKPYKSSNKFWRLHAVTTLSQDTERVFGSRSLQICLSLLSGSHLLFCTSVSLLFRVTEFFKQWLSCEDNATMEM